MSGARRAFNYACRLLGYRQRSWRELALRLRKKGFGDTEVEEALRRLEELGYLDDGAWARALRQRAEEEKLLGYAGARRYLREMGIPAEIADEALEGYDEDGAARRLMRKKSGSIKRLSGDLARRRLADSMRRRGYAGQTVQRALREYIKEEIA